MKSKKSQKEPKKKKSAALNEYDHKKVESKWQKVWEKKKVGQAEDPTALGVTKSGKKNFYALIEFPFPSGDGLHVGHIRSNTAMDIIARKRRREGYNVLYPIGWDAFGLPTENYAIKTGLQPEVVTKKNSAVFRKQLKSLGYSFDWSREINTSDPKYYKWTQWIFLQFLKEGLAYKKKMLINWCPKDLIGLANEEVVNGKCERCGTPVEKREKEQWMLAITKYADRLDKDLDDVDYLERIKIQQRNWIGKSEGAEIDFHIGDTHVKVFTTRPDTLFGVTYIVLAPEHPLVKKLMDKTADKISNKKEVQEYVAAAKAKTDIARTDAKAEKTGVPLEGIFAINPANQEKVPVWIADYVLADYGTGAVMAVPAHDERDWDFSKKYKLPSVDVIIPNIIDERNPPVPGKKIVERKNVHAIVRDPSTGQYLALKWRKYDWTTFPMGGIEEGEDPETAARREVEEETGFTNLKLVKVLDGEVRAEYFAAHKDQNRVSFTTAVLFDLVDETQVDIGADESAAHDTIWLDESKLNYENMTHAEIREWKKKMAESITGKTAFTGEGVLIHSGTFTNSYSEKIKKEITESVGGKWVVKYKLRDWIFSRQRYWGEPIPVIHCEKCGIVPVPEKELPVKLPKVKNYKPTTTGESPLASVKAWVNTKCPNCKGKATRETDTMPNWAGSSWYYLRYADPKNSKAFAAPAKLKYWMPVNWYNGGMEHTTLHLLYSRFWHKFLFDKGLVPTKEPYMKRTSHGLILAPGGEKMSKSKGNVVNPDTIVETVGADSLRLYEMFMGPFDQPIAWDTQNIAGVRRFIERVWKLSEKISTESISSSTKLDGIIHKTMKKVSDDIEAMRFNTAISSMMICVNEFEKEISQENSTGISLEHYEIILKLLAPFAPHVTEELWARLGNKTSIHEEKWLEADPTKLQDASIKIVVQINGKVRASLEVSLEDAEESVKIRTLELPDVKKWLNGQTPKKVIYVKGRLVSIVV